MNTETREPQAHSTLQSRRCPICDGPAETLWCLHEFTYGVGDDAVELSTDLPYGQCAACDFEFLDFDGERCKHEAVCKHLGVLSPWEIKAIRLRYRMSRAEFARLSGLGEATLARWEKGLVTQNRANDRYLRLLAQPGGIERLLAATQTSSGDARRAAPLAQRFRAVRITNELRQEQQIFKLLKAA